MGVKMDQRACSACYYNITGRKIAIERSGEPNAALFAQTAVAAKVHGSGDLLGTGWPHLDILLDTQP
jgi:hypothetical protein